MVVLSVEGSSEPFALKLKPADSLSSIRSRIVKKLEIEEPSEDSLQVKYEWVGVLYMLEDDDDWETFKERIDSSNAKEIRLVISGDAIPAADHDVPHGRKPLATSNGTSQPNDAQSLHSVATAKTSNTYTSGPYAKPGKAHSIHLIASSDSTKAKSISGSEAGSRKKSGYAGSITGTIQTDFSLHSKAFDDFQNSRGVRTFIGSIGPINNVRMMMKNGHRNCYMSREFAQQHNFIPKDAAPGFYGFTGITNLGTWPIKVGEKTVEQQVMLIENAFFPVILGRSFMEKRRVSYDQLDQTSVIFGDTGERVPTDLVVIKDINGKAIPIS